MLFKGVFLSQKKNHLYRENKDEYHLPKGVSNRNKGLEWILKFGVDDAVAYFADDDNTYDLRLFHEVSLLCKAGWVSILT